MVFRKYRDVCRITLTQKVTCIPSIYPNTPDMSHCGTACARLHSFSGGIKQYHCSQNPLEPEPEPGHFLEQGVGPLHLTATGLLGTNSGAKLVHCVS